MEIADVDESDTYPQTIMQKIREKVEKCFAETVSGDMGILLQYKSGKLLTSAVAVSLFIL